MKVLFILNGYKDYSFPQTFFNDYDKIICVDGGYNSYSELNVGKEPDYVIGDFDSIKDKSILKMKFKKEQIIYKDNQDETDSQFAIKSILTLYPNQIKEIHFIFFTSQDRIDHLLCNILLMKQVPTNIKVKLITKGEEMYLLTKRLEINGMEGKTLSVIPITNVKNIRSEGLKWPYEGIDINFGFIGGISNVIESDKAILEINEGECVVVLEKNN